MDRRQSLSSCDRIRLTGETEGRRHGGSVRAAVRVLASPRRQSLSNCDRIRLTGETEGRRHGGSVRAAVNRLAPTRATAAVELRPDPPHRSNGGTETRRFGPCCRQPPCANPGDSHCRTATGSASQEQRRDGDTEVRSVLPSTTLRQRGRQPLSNCDRIRLTGATEGRRHGGSVRAAVNHLAPTRAHSHCLTCDRIPPHRSNGGTETRRFGPCCRQPPCANPRRQPLSNCDRIRLTGATEGRRHGGSVRAAVNHLAPTRATATVELRPDPPHRRNGGTETRRFGPCCRQPPCANPGDSRCRTATGSASQEQRRDGDTEVRSVLPSTTLRQPGRQPLSNCDRIRLTGETEGRRHGGSVRAAVNHLAPTRATATVELRPDPPHRSNGGTETRRFRPCCRQPPYANPGPQARSRKPQAPKNAGAMARSISPCFSASR